MPHYSITVPTLTGGASDIFTPLSPTQALYNTRIKYFGEDFTKIACFSRPIFNPHKMELRGREKSVPKPNSKETSPSQATRNERQDSQKRARDKVFEIAYANNFDYFITLTLDEKKISRTDKEKIKKALAVWLQNLVARRDFKYVICPEYHADGSAIHFHGLCSGDLDLADSGLIHFNGENTRAETARQKDVQGQTIYNIDNWKYGFSTLIKLDNQKERTALYITKYVTKDSDKIIGRYYYSGGKGLVRSVPTEYRNYPYQEFEGQERTILGAALAVKYKTL